MTAELLTSKRWKADPSPRFMPLPARGMKNELGEISAVAQMMGWDLQPWQRRVLRVATQYEETPQGRAYLYREVMITVPRQSGKTTLVSPLGIFRALLRPRSEIYFSAQTGQYAGDYMKKLGSSFETVWHPALRVAFRFLRSNGSEGFKCTNGSVFQRYTRGPEAMHSKTPALVINDEIWNLTGAEGSDLVGAIRPAQATLGKTAQMWNLSTMGTAKSEYMNGLVEIGREGSRPDLCYIEYALAPGADPTDPDLWHTFHPALGNTQSVETLLTDFNALWPKTPGEWERGYCNRLTVTEDVSLIPKWDELGTVTNTISNPAFSAEISSRTYAACIVAAWIDADNRPCVSVVRQGTGFNWVIPTLVKLQAAYPESTIWVDKAGANFRLLDTLEKTDAVSVRPAGINERQIGDQTLLEAARDLRTLRHDHSPAFSAAVTGLAVKTFNGRTRIDRDRSEADPMPFIAAAVALYGATHIEEPYTPAVFV